MSDPLEIFELVRNWSYRPTMWRDFARELLVLIENVRPTVLFDLFPFTNVSVLERFLHNVNERFGTKLCLLTYSHEPFGSKDVPPSIFVARSDFLKSPVKLTSQEFPVLVSIVSVSEAEVMNKESRNKVLSKIESVLAYVSSSLRHRGDYVKAVELKDCIDVELLPTFTGVLLQYPAVYVLEPPVGVAFNPCMDCTLLKIFMKSDIASEGTDSPLDGKHLMSFSVPSNLVQDSRIDVSIKTCLSQLEARVHGSRYLKEIKVISLGVSEAVLRF